MPQFTRIIVTDTAAFESTLKSTMSATAAEKGTLFVLFTGDSDAAGHSWCPDCNDAKPVYEAALADAATRSPITLITCPLPRDEYKGNAAHPYKTNANVKLARIPTLMRWGASRKVGELIEEACKDAVAVRDLIDL
jgi:hypothetical protein